MNNKILKEANKSSLENSNLQNVKPLPLWHDYVFKRVFAYEGNESVLKDFLEGILNIKIDTIEVKNPEIIKTYQEGKKSILDIKVVINDGTIIDVEMQVANEGNLNERTTTYLGQLISEQLQTGDPYTKLKKTIIIFILNFNYIKRNTYHNVGRLRYDEISKETYVDMGYEKDEEIASDYIETHIIEIPKFRKKNPDLKLKLDQWMALLSGEEENVKMVEKENKEIKKAVETLNRISLDPKERELYDSIVLQEFNRQVGLQNTFDSGKIAGIAEGKIAGRAEGQKDKQLEIAKKSLKENIDIETISNITGLTIEEIRTLSQNS